MIIKKLAAPLINEKILQQAEQCYIATASISEPAFDFVKTRLSPKCKIEIVTGLDMATSPMVLRRIWRHYQDRITLNIFTRNFFHPNVYIFDLPYRKAIAFVGSGNFTLEGLKDNEEIFYKITDAKEIEALKSWFTGYFEFSEALTEALIQEYELIYPALKQREIASRQEKRQIIALTTGGFNWDTIKFKNQYFKKEDFLTLGNSKAALNDETVRAERLALRDKLMQLHDSIKDHVTRLRLQPDASQIVSSIDPLQHQKIRTLSLTYGRSKAELKKYEENAKLPHFMTLQVMVKQRGVDVCLVVGRESTGKEDREYFRNQMNDNAAYRNAYFKLISSLGVGYWIEIMGDTKPVETFQNEDALWEFTKADNWLYYTFIIGRSYSPSDVEISNENIAATVIKEFDKLVLIYNAMKHVAVIKVV